MTVTLQKKQEFSTSVIERIRVYAVQYGPKEYSWSAWMPEMTNTDTLVRLETKDGQTGIGAVSSCSERDIDLSIAYNMKPLLRGLLGKDGLQIEENWQWMAQRRPYVHNSAIAALDIAMWDLLAKQNDLPLSSLLGGNLMFYKPMRVFLFLKIQLQTWSSSINLLRQALRLSSFIMRVFRIQT